MNMQELNHIQALKDSWGSSGWDDVQEMDLDDIRNITNLSDEAAHYMYDIVQMERPPHVGLYRSDWYRDPETAVKVMDAITESIHEGHSGYEPWERVVIDKFLADIGKAAWYAK